MELKSPFSEHLDRAPGWVGTAHHQPGTLNVVSRLLRIRAVTLEGGIFLSIHSSRCLV